MNDIDQIFAAISAGFEVLAAQRAEQRQARREAANARRRRIYAAHKAAGTLPPRRQTIEPEPEFDAPTGCYCHTAVMPPCIWCENDGGTDDEELS